MFDIIVIVVVLLLIVRGIWKGLVRQVVGLVGVAAGWIIAMKYSGAVTAKYLAGFSPAVGQIIGFLAVFLGCIIAASIVGWIIGKMMDAAGLGVLNRIAGALAGGLKGYLAIAAVTLVLIAFLSSDNRFLAGSRTMQYIRPATDRIAKYAPNYIRRKYEERTMGRSRGVRAGLPRADTKTRHEPKTVGY